MLEFKVNTRRSLLWDLRGRPSLANSVTPQQVTYMNLKLFSAQFSPMPPVPLAPPATSHICGAHMSWALEAALTHVQLPDKAGHVVVLEILGQHLLGKAALVEHMEAGAILQRR